MRLDQNTYVGGISTYEKKLGYRTMLSVKEYGASGNGTTDDLAAINNAITALSSGDLYLPSGTYLISDDLTVSDNIKLVFERGAQIKISDTKTLSVADLSASGQCFEYGGSSAVVTIRPGWLPAIAAGWWGLVEDDNTAATANTSALNRCIGTGLSVRLPMGTFYINGTLTMTNRQKVSGAGMNETTLTFTGTSDSMIQYENCGECILEHLELDGDDNADVIGLDLVLNSMSLRRSTFDHVQFSNMDSYAVKNEKGFLLTFRDCLFDGSGDHQFYTFDQATNLRFERCRFTNIAAGKYGFYANDPTGGVYFSNCTFGGGSSAVGRGIYIEGGPFNIETCRFERLGVTDTGIELGNSWGEVSVKNCTGFANSGDGPESLIKLTHMGHATRAKLTCDNNRISGDTNIYIDGNDESDNEAKIIILHDDKEITNNANDIGYMKLAFTSDTPPAPFIRMIESGGGFDGLIYPHNVLAVSTTGTISEKTSVEIVDCTANSRVRTLPDNATNANARITVFKDDSSTNILFVVPAGSDTINGGGTYTINAQYNYVTLESDGTGDWKITNAKGVPGHLSLDFLNGIARSGTWTPTYTSGLPNLARLSANNTTEMFDIHVPLPSNNYISSSYIRNIEMHYTVDGSDSGDDIQLHLGRRELPANGDAQGANTVVAGEDNADYDGDHENAAERVLDTEAPQNHTLTMTIPVADRTPIGTDESRLIVVKVIEADNGSNALDINVKGIIVNYDS